jgi:hypothetical protein
MRNSQEQELPRFQQGKLGLRGFEAKAISAYKMKAKQGPPFEGPKPEAFSQKKNDWIVHASNSAASDKGHTGAL